jgi:hypothetical protein
MIKLWLFGIFSPVLVYCVKKCLATLSNKCTVALDIGRRGVSTASVDVTDCDFFGVSVTYVTLTFQNCLLGIRLMVTNFSNLAHVLEEELAIFFKQ